MNKKIISAVGILAVASAAGIFLSPQFKDWQAQRAIEQAKQAKYDSELEKTVSLHWGWKGFSSEDTGWYIKVADSRKAPLAKWDELPEQPQIITQIWRHEDRKKAGLYTMNLDGSNLQMLLTPEETGGLVSWLQRTRPFRSPNGRYIFFDMGLFETTKSCAWADLKTREIVRFGGACLFGGWLPDSSKAYVYVDFDIQEFDSQTMTLSRLPLKSDYPRSRDIDRTGMTEEQHSKIIFDTPENVRLTGDGKTLLVNIKAHYMIDKLNRKAEPRLYQYKIGDWQHYSLADYYPKECDLNKLVLWREDGHAFVCDTEQGKRSFSTADLSQSYPLAKDAVYVLQHNVLAGDKPANILLRRNRQQNEQSPIDKLRYFYSPKVKGDDISGFSLYIPPHLVDDFDHYNLVDTLPPLPTHKQYQDAYDKYFEQKTKKCEKFWQDDYQGKDVSWDECQDVCEIKRVGDRFVTSSQCKPVKGSRRG